MADLVAADEALAVVRALREGLGEEVELYVDGNRGWTPSESLRALDMLADADGHLHPDGTLKAGLGGRPARRET